MGDNSPSLLALAAAGDCDAQGILRDELLMEIANVESGYTLPILLSQAEVFARLAAAQGTSNDTLKLVAVLVTHAEVCARDGRLDEAGHFEGEALGIIERVLISGNDEAIGLLAHAMTALADRGNEIAAVLVGQMIDAMPRNSAAAISASAAALKSQMETQS